MTVTELEKILKKYKTIEFTEGRLWIPSEKLLVMVVADYISIFDDEESARLLHTNVKVVEEVRGLVADLKKFKYT